MLVALGMASSFLISRMLYRDKVGPVVGLTQRVAPLRAGYNLLWNKYYLDDLYEKVIVRGVAGPIATAAYWINQNILDGIVNTAGKSATLLGRFVYKYIDQGVIDGVANGSGRTATGAGGSLRPIQSGKIQAYGALLFGAAALAALALIIFQAN